MENKTFIMADTHNTQYNIPLFGFREQKEDPAHLLQIKDGFIDFCVFWGAEKKTIRTPYTGSFVEGQTNLHISILKHDSFINNPNFFDTVNVDKNHPNSNENALIFGPFANRPDGGIDIIQLFGIELCNHTGDLKGEIYRIYNDKYKDTVFHFTPKGIDEFFKYMMKTKNINIYTEMLNHVYNNVYKLGINYYQLFPEGKDKFNWFTTVEIYFNRDSNQVEFHQDCGGYIVQTPTLQGSRFKSNAVFLQLEFIDSPPSMPTEISLLLYNKNTQGENPPPGEYNYPHQHNELFKYINKENNELIETHYKVITLFIKQWIILFILHSIYPERINQWNSNNQNDNGGCNKIHLEYLFPPFNEYYHKNILPTLVNQLKITAPELNFFWDDLRGFFNPNIPNYNYYYNFLKNNYTAHSPDEIELFSKLEMIRDRIRTAAPSRIRLWGSLVDTLYKNIKDDADCIYPHFYTVFKHVILQYQNNTNFWNTMKIYINVLMNIKQKLSAISEQKIENYDTFFVLDPLFKHTTPYGFIRPCIDTRDWGDKSSTNYNQISQPMYVRQLDSYPVLWDTKGVRRSFFRYHWFVSKDDRWQNILYEKTIYKMAIQRGETENITYTYPSTKPDLYMNTFAKIRNNYTQKELSQDIYINPF